jgi:FeS assembly SUF system protein
MTDSVKSSNTILPTELQIIEAIKGVYDPEIPVDIYELGLIYKIEIKPTSEVEVTMTLTSPMCPVAGSMPFEVKQKVEAVKGVKEAFVELTFDPPWTKELMSEEALLELGML